MRKFDRSMEMTLPVNSLRASIPRDFASVPSIARLVPGQRLILACPLPPVHRYTSQRTLWRCGQFHCQLFLSIFNAPVFSDLQIPFFTSPLFSHLSETPGSGLLPSILVVAGTCHFYLPFLFINLRTALPATPLFSQPSALPGWHPSAHSHVRDQIEQQDTGHDDRADDS